MKTSHVLTIAKFIFWVIFIGLIIKAGALLFNFGMSISNPENAKKLYIGLDLYKLRNDSMPKFINIATLLICTTGIQIYLAYLAIRVTTLGNIKHPFTKEIATLISKISHTALVCGIISIIADQYCQRLAKKGFGVVLNLDSPQVINEVINIDLSWSGQEFLFLAVVVFIISKVFQRGIALQSENELTI